MRQCDSTVAACAVDNSHSATPDLGEQLVITKAGCNMIRPVAISTGDRCCAVRSPQIPKPASTSVVPSKSGNRIT